MTRRVEAEEHGSKDRGATYVMQTVLHASKRSVSLDGHHTDITGLGRPCPAPGREWGPDLYPSRP